MSKSVGVALPTSKETKLDASRKRSTRRPAGPGLAKEQGEQPERRVRRGRAAGGRRGRGSQLPRPLRTCAYLHARRDRGVPGGREGRRVRRPGLVPDWQQGAYRSGKNEHVVRRCVRYGKGGPGRAAG